MRLWRLLRLRAEVLLRAAKALQGARLQLSDPAEVLQRGVNVTEIFQVVQSFGLPAGMLAALCLFLWRVLCWLKPWAEKLFERHIALLEENTKAVQKLQELHDHIMTVQVTIQTRLDCLDRDGCGWARKIGYHQQGDKK